MMEPKPLEKLDQKLQKAASRRPIKTVAVNFALLTLIIIGIVVYFSLSEAWIIINPPEEEFASMSRIEVGLGKDINGNVHEKNVSASGEFEATKVMEKIGRSEGVVTIYNKSGKNQPLRETTRLITKDGKLFRLKKFVNVTALGQAQAEIYADKEGRAYEIEPQMLTLPALWPGLKDKIYAELKEPTSKAIVKKMFVSEDDLKKAEESLKKMALEKAASQTNKNIKQENLYLKSFSFTGSKKLGDEALSFTATSSSLVGFVEFSVEDLKKVFSARAALDTPPGKEFLGIRRDSLSFSIESYDPDLGSAVIKAQAKGIARLSSVNPPVKKERILGLKKQSAIKELEEQLGGKYADIKLWPFWVRRVPYLQDHVKIKINDLKGGNP